MKGNIFNIQRFSIHDGPGIRTTVFLKGCNLRCKWCHNPESFSVSPELKLATKLCSQCKRCINVCENQANKLENNSIVINRDLCNKCFKCIDVCFSGAREKVGSSMTAEDIIKEVLKDKRFYDNSGGGVTFSGGEPLLQVDFLKDLLIISKHNGLNTAIETAGNVEIDAIKEIIDYVDLFLFDIKHIDSIKHKEATGVSNEKILKNLIYLSKKNKDVIIRIPIIPTVNDDCSIATGISEFIVNNTKYCKIELLPFHKLGEDKYDGVGIKYELRDTPLNNKERLEELEKIICEYGIEVKISK